jgi:hypothetical protein
VFSFAFSLYIKAFCNIQGGGKKVAIILQQAPLNENSATIKGRNC